MGEETDGAGWEIGWLDGLPMLENDPRTDRMAISSVALFGKEFIRTHAGGGLFGCAGRSGGVEEGGKQRNAPVDRRPEPLFPRRADSRSTPGETDRNELGRRFRNGGRDAVRAAVDVGSDGAGVRPLSRTDPLRNPREI